MRDTSRYTVNGQRVVSVTEALVISGVVDFSGVPLDLLEAARERGRRVHELCAEVARGDIENLEPEFAPYVDAFCQFLETSGFKPHLIEHPVVNERYRYAGTLDLTGDLDGEMILIDIKTGRSPRWAGLQLAGYALAFAPTTLKRFSLELRPDGGYRLKPFRSYADYPDFLACVRIAQWLIKERGIVL